MASWSWYYNRVFKYELEQGVAIQQVKGEGVSTPDIYIYDSRISQHKMYKAAHRNQQQFGKVGQMSSFLPHIAAHLPNNTYMILFSVITYDYDDDDVMMMME